MTITYIQGNIFSSKADAIINPVNCVGVMGKGLALEFKKRWPNNFDVYKNACNKGELKPGIMLTVAINNNAPRYIINFPTKLHWRDSSELSYIANGLDALIVEIQNLDIKSVAIPQLGCGNGGLNWAIVKPIIESKLANISHVEFEIYTP